MWGVVRLIFALGALALATLPSVAGAQDITLFAPETLSISADVRTTAAGGEESWLDGEFGKLRTGDQAGLRLGNADLVWQPRFGWALSGTVVATAQGAPRSEAGLSEAYLSLKPPASGPVRVSGRAGLVWAPLSLEHGGAGWHVLDTITPSAINSWVGEELSPLVVEASLSARLGEHKLTATAAAIAANDTAGTLLALRGWALHDRKALAGRRQPLPELSEEMEYVQPRFTHPLLDVAPGFAKRPGYYAKLAWEPPLPFRVEAFHYDNRADPEASNADLEWGWRTRFSQVAGEVRLGKATSLKAQALHGRTRMGFLESDGIWVDTTFRSAFALLTHRRGDSGVAARVEAFGTRQRGSFARSDDAEHGWAATLAGHRDLGRHLSLWAEVLRVDSRREARLREGEAPRQRQVQGQLMLRASW